MKVAPHVLAGFLAAALSSGPLSPLVSAYSDGAGTCIVTADGPAFPSPDVVNNPHFGNGAVPPDISGRNYQASVDGVVLSTDAPVDVTLGGASGITLDGNAFAGFLVTMRADGQDLGGALTAAGDDSRSLEAGGNGTDAVPGTSFAVCPAGVAGGTHTNSDDKESVFMQIRDLPPGPVDVTVTIMRRGRQWYHNNFVMNVLDAGSIPPPSNGTDMPTMMPAADEGTTEPTMMPDVNETVPEPTAMPVVTPPGNGTTMEPTMMPGNGTVPEEPTAMPVMMPTNDTDAPTMMPIANTSEPTAMPTTMPTVMPTDAPTAMPTDAPTATPTDEPSSSPSATPTTEEPTSAPTASPSTPAPTDEPSSSPSLTPTLGSSAPVMTRSVAAMWTAAAAVVGTALAWTMA